MADPQGFITIEDFSPGVVSDLHAARNASTEATGLKGSTPSNGAAQARGTWLCKVDKNGALGPMPELLVTNRWRDSGSNPREYQIPWKGNWSSGYQPGDYQPVGYEDAYLLDAEVLPQSDGNADLVFTLWTFWFAADGNGSIGGYHQYMLGQYETSAETSHPEPGVNYKRTATIFLVKRSSELQADEVPTIPVGRLSLVWGTPIKLGWDGAPSQIHDGRFPSVVLMASWADPSLYPSVYGPMTPEDKALQVPTKVWNGAAYTNGPPLELYSPGIMPSPGYNNSLGIRVGASGSFLLLSTGAVWAYTGVSGPLWHAHRVWHYGQNPNEKSSWYYMSRLFHHYVWHQGRSVISGNDNMVRHGSVRGPALSSGPLQPRYFYSDWSYPINLKIDYQSGVAPIDGDQDSWSYTVPSYSDPNAWYGYRVGSNGENLLEQFHSADFGEDIVSPDGCIGSVTNDQLLCIRHQGGAILVTGDLDYPTVRKLPGVHSTHGVNCVGAQTPIGFVYGSRFGVHVWQGGDSSKLISPQLDGFFWDVTQGRGADVAFPGNNVENPLGNHGSAGRFAYWNECIYAPNDWVYDIASSSWWRLNALPETSTSTRRATKVYAEGSGGALYSFPWNNTPVSGGRIPFATVSVPTRLASQYAWLSQPLVETRDRTVSIQDVRLLVSVVATSTITVTLAGFDPDGNRTSRVVTFTAQAADGDLQLLRKDITNLSPPDTPGSFHAEYITVGVNAVASNSAPAPKIHSIRVGYGERARTRRNG